MLFITLVNWRIIIKPSTTIQIVYHITHRCHRIQRCSIVRNSGSYIYFPSLIPSVRRWTRTSEIIREKKKGNSVKKNDSFDTTRFCFHNMTLFLKLDSASKTRFWARFNYDCLLPPPTPPTPHHQNGKTRAKMAKLKLKQRKLKWKNVS